MNATDLYSVEAALTTHALDLARGCPASGLKVELFRIEAGERSLVTSAVTNANGRSDGPLLTRAQVAAGTYILEFDTRSYHGAAAPFGRIPVEFSIADPEGHYHVPLIFAPGGYSTYRGAPPSRTPRDGGTWDVAAAPGNLPAVESAPSWGGAGLSIHVIDLARGVGAGGLSGVLLCREIDGGAWQTVRDFAVNGEGRTDRWLIEDGGLARADYEIVYDTGAYYAAAGFGVGALPFFSSVRIRLRVEDRTTHHHVPLLLSPWGYSCYRGS